jgi:hypothetical protein
MSKQPNGETERNYAAQYESGKDQLDRTYWELSASGGARLNVEVHYPSYGDLVEWAASSSEYSRCAAAHARSSQTSQ